MPTLAHEARVVGRLSLPMVVGNVAMYGMGFVDTLVVGPLGKDALAGVSMANNWAFACTVLGLGALRVVDPVVSQAHGAGDTRSVGRALNNAIGLALALSVPMWLMLATTAWVLPALGQAPALVPFAARYCAILALGVPGSFAFAALRQVLQGMGIVRGDLRSKRIAVLGAGGVARAVAAGLADEGARVVVFSRGEERARGGHGDAGIVRRDGHQLARRDAGDERLDRSEDHAR